MEKHHCDRSGSRTCLAMGKWESLGEYVKIKVAAYGDDSEADLESGADEDEGDVV